MQKCVARKSTDHDRDSNGDSLLVLRKAHAKNNNGGTGNGESFLSGALRLRGL